MKKSLRIKLPGDIRTNKSLKLLSETLIVAAGEIKKLL